MKSIFGVGAVLTAIFFWPVAGEAQVSSGTAYRIVSTCGTGEKVLMIEGNSTANLARAVIATRNSRLASQIFRIEKVGTAYKLTSQHSGKVLDVQSGLTTNYTPIIQYDYHGDSNQLFRITSPVAGIYQFRAVHSRKNIDLEKGDTTEGNRFIQYTVSKTACSQRFKLEAVAMSPSPTPAPTPPPIPLPTATPTPAPTATPGPVSGTVSFLSSWATDANLGKWSHKHVKAPERLQRDPNGEKTWHGRAAARVEVNPHDTTDTTERAEVVHMMTANRSVIYENESSGTQYYAVSYKFPTSWQNSDDVAGDWSIVLQIHGPDELATNPSFALHANTQFQLSGRGGDINTNRGWGRINFNDASGLNLGRWTDLIIRIKHAKDSTGAVTVYRRNEGQSGFIKVVDLTGVPTLQYKGTDSTIGQHYWKQGLYRNKAPGITNIFWMGDTVRGTSFSAVEQAVFGTNSGEPR